MKKIGLILSIIFVLLSNKDTDTTTVHSFIKMDDGVKNKKAAEYVSAAIDELPVEFMEYFNGSIIITDNISKYDKYSASNTQGLFLDGNVYIKERDDKDYSHVVSHELSHNLDYQLGFQLGHNYFMSGRDLTWLELIDKYDYVNQEQGMYANVSHGEFFAEIFSDFLTNPSYVQAAFPEIYDVCINLSNLYL